MKVYVFGTCAGTEPIPGTHHVSFAVRHNEQLYWFDAGECCSYTAQMMGVDVRDINSIFISHTHMDHIGGLGNLLWNIRKLDMRDNKCDGKTIRLFMPDTKTGPALKCLLEQTEGGFICRFSIAESRVSDGVLLDECGIKVTALHNSHLPPFLDGTFRSFSYMIEADGKTLVFTGDTGSYFEIEPFIRRADVLMAETGHHTPKQVCEALNKMGCMPEKLLFIHNGRPLLFDRENAVKEAKAVYNGYLQVLNDRDTFSM